MVKRVVGTVDGTEVILSRTSGNRWEVPVPLNEDGEYVVEIMAEDDAGNWTYLAKMLFAVNRALLCTHVLMFPFYAKMLQGSFEVTLFPDTFFAEIDVVENYHICLCEADYWAEIIEPECEE